LFGHCRNRYFAIQGCLLRLIHPNDEIKAGLYFRFGRQKPGARRTPAKDTGPVPEKRNLEYL